MSVSRVFQCFCGSAFISSGSWPTLQRASKLLLPVHTQTRTFAARRGKRIAVNRANQLKAKQRKEAMKNEEPKKWTPPKLRINKGSLNLSPRRFSDADRRDLKLLVDDVYVIDQYKEMSYSLDAIIEMHRETHHPQIYDQPDALVDARIELSLKTKKKTKFLDTFSGIFRYPNDFGYGGNRQVIAICKKEADIEDAKQEGAVIVGSTDIIRQIKVGDLLLNDYDDLVCHGDMLIELASIRGILGKSFPTKLRGNLGFDMKKLVRNFVNGIEYKCIKDDFELDYGWVELPFGKLDMPIETLQENLEHLLYNVQQNAPAGAPGPFITRVILSSQPSNEKFKLKHWMYIDDYEDPESPEDENDEENKSESTNLSN